MGGGGASQGSKSAFQDPWEARPTPHRPGGGKIATFWDSFEAWEAGPVGGRVSLQRVLGCDPLEAHSAPPQGQIATFWDSFEAWEVSVESLKG